MDAGQANATQNHARVCDPATAAGHGVVTTAANAVSVGSQPVGIAPHGKVTEGPAPDLGIIDGAKKSIAVINMTLTILRTFIFRLRQPRKPTLDANIVRGMALLHFRHSGNDSAGRFKGRCSVEERVEHRPARHDRAFLTRKAVSGPQQRPRLDHRICLRPSVANL
jgi:hypothetical protein